MFHVIRMRLVYWIIHIKLHYSDPYHQIKPQTCWWVEKILTSLTPPLALWCITSTLRLVLLMQSPGAKSFVAPIAVWSLSRYNSATWAELHTIKKDGWRYVLSFYWFLYTCTRSLVSYHMVLLVIYIKFIWTCCIPPVDGARSPNHVVHHLKFRLLFWTFPVL